MKEQAGVWIDHREAVLVFVVGKGDERMARFVSGVEKHGRVAGLSAKDAPEGDHRDRQFADHLAKYYDDLIQQLGASSEVFVFGPGEAKAEFQKRMEVKGHGGRIVAIEAADKMTDPQIAAMVREHFEKRGHERTH